MMRLPRFRYVAPKTVEEACKVLAAEGPQAMVVAGGTDLLPNMKRRQQTPRVVVGLRRIGTLRSRTLNGTATLGAGLTLTELERDGLLKVAYPALQMAAFSVATPHLRNMGTLGGNICLDTRCNYYDQGYEWRQSIDFCMKKDGKTCWVAPGSPRCWAVSSSDTAPVLVALGARVTLVSAKGERTIGASELYLDDGIKYLARRPDEILTQVHLPAHEGWVSTYKKCRRRGAFDFPILSVAAVARLEKGTVEDARIVFGGVGSHPVSVDASGLRGKALTDDLIEETAEKAAKAARPLDNTDLTMTWRKRVAAAYVAAALKELRGDGPQRVPTGLLAQVGA
ncbi:MAG TPA: FAD binding domain-containing protein [Planctomycetota bacterium]|nr:FAD binding domain-containing protein [Planctomycetota bacterium]